MRAVAAAAGVMLVCFFYLTVFARKTRLLSLIGYVTVQPVAFQRGNVCVQFVFVERVCFVNECVYMFHVEFYWRFFRCL